ncbi:hemicentin-1-like [Saccoglossus kowalevskii]
MSLSAIETALTISLPSSFIYVFTDARAKDFDLTENVLKLIQEKQSQVVFVMTGDCGNRSHVGFQAYEDIAATSSGQLFMLNKSDVDEVRFRVRVLFRFVEKTKSIHCGYLRYVNVTLVCPVPPVIGHSPSNYTAIKDTTVTLRCPAHGTPKPTITWQRNGQIISPNDPSYYIRSDGSLQIDGVHTSDSGTYVCMASNPAGVNSKNIHLIVHVAPSIIGDVSQVVTVTLGEPITLPCHAESIPPPTKSWTKENLTISRNNLHYEVKNSGSLHISRVESSDSGVYICTISNVVGDTKKEIRLKVNVPPRISPGPSHITAVVGDSVILPCESIGDPVPDVRWNHNEWRLNMNSEDFLLLDSGSLQISNVKVKSGGRYRCSITSIAGSDTKDITLTVQEPPNIADTPKVVDSFPNSRVTIPCPVTGFPRPHITWYKDGKVVDTSDHGLRVRSDGSLFIMNTEDEDRGYYTCHAVNDAGSANITLLLNINGKFTVVLLGDHNKFTS